MELWQIRYFVTAADAKSISAAAKRLHISQPPLSRQIKALEEELGCLLFERSASGLTLTEAGALLYERGTHLLSTYDTTLSDIQNLLQQERNQITLGSLDGSRALIEPKVARLFEKNFSNADIHSITCREFDEVLVRLNSGQLDIAMVRYPFPNTEDYDTVRICADYWIALMGTQYPVPDSWGNTITLAQLCNDPLILPTRKTLHEPIVETLLPLNPEVNVICYYFELTNAVTLIRHTLGVAIAPSSILSLIGSRNVIVKTITGLPVETGYVAIKRKDNHALGNTDITNRFWTVLQRYASKL